MSRETPCVNILNDRYLRLGKPSTQSPRRPPVRVSCRQLADDHSRNLRRSRFRILGVDSVVADLGRRHHHDLSAIRWVGEDLLIAGHVGREHDFSDGLRGSGARSNAQAPTKKGSVLEEEKPWFRRSQIGDQFSVEEWPEVEWW